MRPGSQLSALSAAKENKSEQLPAWSVNRPSAGLLSRNRNSLVINWLNHSILWETGKSLALLRKVRVSKNSGNRGLSILIETFLWVYPHVLKVNENAIFVISCLIWLTSWEIFGCYLEWSSPAFKKHAPCRNTKQLGQNRKTVSEVRFVPLVFLKCACMLNTGLEHCTVDLVFEQARLHNSLTFGMLYFKHSYYLIKSPKAYESLHRRKIYKSPDWLQLW